MQEVQRAALGRKQRAGIGADLAKHLIGHDALAIGGAPDNFGGRIENPDAAVEPGAAAKDAGFAGNDRGPRDTLARNQAGGQVTGTDILGEGCLHVAGDFGGERVSEFDGHGGGQ